MIQATNPHRADKGTRRTNMKEQTYCYIIFSGNAGEFVTVHATSYGEAKQKAAVAKKVRRRRYQSKNDSIWNFSGTCNDPSQLKLVKSYSIRKAVL
jgi:hypothetical protein